MRNWEKEYQAYNSIEEDKKIAQLEQKIQDKTISKEEYNELKNKKNIRSNINKVSNIIELRDSLVAKKEEIKKELDRRQLLKDTSKEQEKLEKRLSEILLEQDKLKQDLKNPDLKEEDKEKISKKIEKLNLERDDNNKDFQEKQNILRDYAISEGNALAKINDKDLEKQNFEISTKISKCNMVGNSLMNGLNWDAIELKLENWQDRKYTTPKKTPIRELKKEEPKVEKKKEVKSKKEPEETNIMDPKEVELWEKRMKEKAAKNVQKIIAQKNNLPAKTGFLGKHPKLNKFLNSIKEKFNGILRRKIPYEKYIDNKYKNKQNTGPRKTSDAYKEAMKQQDEIVKQKEKENIERLKEEQEKRKDNNEFRDYLKKVAEKGMDIVEKEEEIKKTEKYQKYKEAKEAKMKANGDQVIHASKEYRDFAKEEER